MALRSVFILASLSMCASCTTTLPDAPQQDAAVLWVKHAAEYDAISLQVYQAAGAALAGYIDDTSWSALPGQSDAEGLPPAVIFDVDETVVSGVDFQMTLVDAPFSNQRHDRWSSTTTAPAIPGFTEFATAARGAGVELFFLTNRPCEPVEGDACPQETTTLDDVNDTGIATDRQHVLLVGEQDDWTKEKLVRREYIARTHRVIMVFGDDLGDFIFCARGEAAAPCTEDATEASRDRLVNEYRQYFGAGWYVLPNPMYGSWTTVE